MDFDEYIRQGCTFCEEGKTGPAIESFEAALKLQPDNPELQQVLQQAIGELMKIESSSHSDRGYEYKDIFNYKEAIKEFNRAIELDSKNGAAYAGRADSYSLLCEWEKAAADYTRAIALNKQDDFLFYYRGMANYFLDKDEEALSDLETALRLNPEDTKLKEMIEIVKRTVQKQKKMAESCVNEAKSRAKVMEELFGVKLEEITDVGKIIAEYTQAPKSSHDSAKNILASAYYISGLLFDSKREYAEAVKAYSEAINNEPNHRFAFKRRGMANLEIGKIENCNQAIEDFKKANLDDAKLKEKLADAYWKRAIAYDQKGDKAHVIEDCERILELNPNDANARELLNMIKTQM